MHSATPHCIMALTLRSSRAKLVVVVQAFLLRLDHAAGLGLVSKYIRRLFRISYLTTNHQPPKPNTSTAMARTTAKAAVNNDSMRNYMKRRLARCFGGGNYFSHRR
jgi:hypothetical protein